VVPLNCFVDVREIDSKAVLQYISGIKDHARNTFEKLDLAATPILKISSVFLRNSKVNYVTGHFLGPG
jgi:hypothetical protein